jgi:hypothetical protein
MAAARVTAGNEGLQRCALEAMCTYCMMQGESLATKELCPEMSEVMDTIIITVNYIKTRPLKSRHLQNYARKWAHNIRHSCFNVILVGCKRKRCGSCLQLLRKSNAVFIRKKSSTCWTFSQ